MEEQKTDARVVEPCWGQCRATAADNETKDATVTPNQVTHEVCICAAVSLDGEVIRGHRHPDTMRTALERRQWQESNGRISRGGLLIQGFVTSTGRFVDRREGLRLQLAAGVPSKAEGGYRGDSLFSEDLY